MEQTEVAVKIEVEAAVTSAANCKNEIVVDFIKQEPGLPQSVKSEPSLTNDTLLKEEILVDSSQDGSEQQCVYAPSTQAGAAGVNEICSTILDDSINFKYESAEVDIEPAVLQHMDTHYTINKNIGTATKENAVVVDGKKAMPGSGVKKKNIEGEWRDGSEQQCVDHASTSSGVNETCSTSLNDLLNVKYESEEMDIGPTVLQHMDSHYTIHKNISAATEEITVVVDCNEAMPGSGVKKENIEDNMATSHACNQTTTEVNDDETHVDSHLSKIRDISFAQSCGLIQHVTVHTNEKPYRCHICDARFTGSFDLTKHVRVHTGEKPYQCEMCDARFTQISGLNSHMKFHTGEKPFQCKICDARFSWSCNLNRHLRVHTGEKPFQCKICDARFAHSNSLAKHLRIHTGEKSYNSKLFH